MSGPLLEIEELVIEARTPRGPVTLVDGLSFTAAAGEITALVGESGCGKSMTALAILGLLPPRVTIRSGRISCGGRRLDTLTEDDYLEIRGRQIAMIFQEPMTSLNPLQTVGDQVAEVYRVHEKDSLRSARARAVTMLTRVGIPDPAARAGQYPHQMSGGMRQRVMIAMALAASPQLLLADEPTTALDVTIQAQILDLLRELIAGDASTTGVLLITHDMGVVAETARKLVVMYSGADVEQGSVRDVFRRPAHPYTAGLLAAIPHGKPRGATLPAIPGSVPRPGERPAGCAFAPRCCYAFDDCRQAPIPRVARGDASHGSVLARCLKESL